MMLRETKGQSKDRRLKINKELHSLREQLPVDDANRARLSQLQVLSLACNFVRKTNYFSKLFEAELDMSLLKSEYELGGSVDFGRSLLGVILVTTKDAKLLYISDNCSSYIGHSMYDILSQGDSICDLMGHEEGDIITEKLKNAEVGETVSFFCHFNVASSRRSSSTNIQPTFLVRGHCILSPACDRYNKQPVFVGLCTSMLNTQTRANTLVDPSFHTVHGSDMTIVKVSNKAEMMLGYSQGQMDGISWYRLIHPEDLHTAVQVHYDVISTTGETSGAFVCRLIKADDDRAYLYVNLCMQAHHLQQSARITCFYQILTEQESTELREIYAKHKLLVQQRIASKTSRTSSRIVIKQHPVVTNTPTLTPDNVDTATQMVPLIPIYVPIISAANQNRGVLAAPTPSPSADSTMSMISSMSDFTDEGDDFAFTIGTEGLVDMKDDDTWQTLNLGLPTPSPTSSSMSEASEGDNTLSSLSLASSTTNADLPHLNPDALESFFNNLELGNIQKQGLCRKRSNSDSNLNRLGAGSRQQQPTFSGDARFSRNMNFSQAAVARQVIKPSLRRKRSNSDSQLDCPIHHKRDSLTMGILENDWLTTLTNQFDL